MRRGTWRSPARFLLLLWAAPLGFAGFLGLTINWPVHCSVACASDDLSGSVGFAALTVVVLVLDAAGVIATIRGSKRIALFGLGSATIAMALALL